MSETYRMTAKEKKEHNAFLKKIEKVGTGRFTYNENCSICGSYEKVDINGECKKCYNGMKKFRGQTKSKFGGVF